eukprot:7890132-Pyramimonas_sp.AAC.1
MDDVGMVLDTSLCMLRHSPATLDLVRFLGVEATVLGERGQNLRASWASVFYRPKLAGDQLQVCSGWRWVHHAFAELAQAIFNFTEDEGHAAVLQ